MARVVRTAIFIVLVIAFIAIPASAWGNSSYLYKVDIPYSSGAYQVLVNISNSTGTSNGTHLFCKGHCNSTFNDTYFMWNDTTPIPYWLETIESGWGTFRVNITSAYGTVNWYYGNNTIASSSNGSNTFYDFISTNSSSFLRPLLFSTGGYAYRVNLNATAGHDTEFGLAGTYGLTPTNGIYDHILLNLHYTDTVSGGSMTEHNTGVASLDEVVDIYWYNSSLVRFYKNGTQVSADHTTTIPTTPMGIINYHTSGTSVANYQFVRKLSLPEPTFTTVGDEEIDMLTSFGNNFTNDSDQDFSLSATTFIQFNVTNGGNYTASNYMWFLNNVNQSNNNNSLNVSVSEVTANNVTVIAVNSTSGYTQSITWTVTLPFQLLTPVNNSVMYTSYPPLITDVTFTWNAVAYPYYQIEVASDTNFNLIQASEFTSSTSIDLSLLTGSHFWHVRSYDQDTLTYGNWSPTFNFSILANETITGPAVRGVVYEMVSGGPSPIDGATVTIYNSVLNWSSTQIVGSNGYYLFTGLVNSTTYYVTATMSGYDSVTALPVTTGLGDVLTHDIQLRRTVNPYIPDYIDARFRLVFAKNNTGYEDAAVEVYEYGNAALVYDSAVTGIAGYVTFHLDLNQRYILEFSDLSTGTLLATWSGYPKLENTVYILDSTNMTVPTVVNNSIPTNVTGGWGIYDFTNVSLQSNYEIGVKGQGLIMSIIALFMIPYGGIVAMIVIAFGFAYLGLLSYPFVMVSGVFCAAWYLIKKEFS